MSVPVKKCATSPANWYTSIRVHAVIPQAEALLSCRRVVVAPFVEPERRSVDAMQGVMGLTHLAPSLAAILVPFFIATDIQRAGLMTDNVPRSLLNGQGLTYTRGPTTLDPDLETPVFSWSASFRGSNSVVEC